MVTQTFLLLILCAHSFYYSYLGFLTGGETTLTFSMMEHWIGNQEMVIALMEWLLLLSESSHFI